MTALARERALRGEGKYERKQNNYSEILAQAVRSTLSLRAIGRTDSEFKAVRAGTSSPFLSLRLPREEPARRLPELLTLSKTSHTLYYVNEQRTLTIPL